MKFYSKYLKRLLDTVISSILVILLSPLLILVAISIKFDSKGPVFFKQKRVGKDLNIFDVYKFRTMTDEEREVKKIVGRSDGVTRIGYYLRRYKIDELPQLFNVVKGQMSMVGPRPSIVKQLEQMEGEQKKRYSVRPGMTGLAQVSGNIHIPWEERFVFDLRYIGNVTFLNDVRILGRTFLIIFTGEEKFKDNPLSIGKLNNG